MTGELAPILQGDVPAVAVATPAQTHFELVRACLEAGKDVFVEKPITLDRAEAEELVELASERKRILMVGHLLLYQPAVERIVQAIGNGAVGRPRSLHQERLKLGRVRSVENVLWSFGVHDIAVLLHLARREPVDVAVRAQRVLQAGIEDDVHLHMDFGNDLQAHLHTSWLWPEVRRRLVVVGEEGMLVFDELSSTLTLHRKRIAEDLSSVDEGEQVILGGRSQPLERELRHFLDCVVTRKKPLSDGQSGVHVLRVLEQADRQMEES
jgi:predicted dehydrogenase